MDSFRGRVMNDAIAIFLVIYAFMTIALLFCGGLLYFAPFYPARRALGMMLVGLWLALACFLAFLFGGFLPQDATPLILFGIAGDGILLGGVHGEYESLNSADKKKIGR